MPAKRQNHFAQLPRKWCWEFHSVPTNKQTGPESSVRVQGSRQRLEVASAVQRCQKLSVNASVYGRWGMASDKFAGSQKWSESTLTALQFVDVKRGGRGGMSVLVRRCQKSLIPPGYKVLILHDDHWGVERQAKAPGRSPWPPFSRT